MVWDAIMQDTLEEMWARGCRARDIARKIGGVTRNAVIGRAHRCGLGRPGPTTLFAAGDHDCRWMTGGPEFEVCGARVTPGRPYCAAHCRRAYAPPSSAKFVPYKFVGK